MMTRCCTVPEGHALVNAFAQLSSEDGHEN